MILDLDKLPAAPSKTQCPECKEFIVTETFTSVSSVTWMVCLMTALIGYETAPSILVNHLHVIIQSDLDAPVSPCAACVMVAGI